MPPENANRHHEAAHSWLIKDGSAFYAVFVFAVVQFGFSRNKFFLYCEVRNGAFARRETH
jgi:hypothetical protein